eukprot:TRINITY_DN7433_c0_g1_i1.p1 TRINITY_DN7433_c0_g1~~TRINITY_DN7433_c0_g1_i1.p1  ORF type:complete len:624 (-),score=25.97 TRINITY_DN7433_c0_g1_i1:168-2039(-)
MSRFVVDGWNTGALLGEYPSSTSSQDPWNRQIEMSNIWSAEPRSQQEWFIHQTGRMGSKEANSVSFPSRQGADPMLGRAGSKQAAAAPWTSSFAGGDGVDPMLGRAGSKQAAGAPWSSGSVPWSSGSVPVHASFASSVGPLSPARVSQTQSRVSRTSERSFAERSPTIFERFSSNGSCLSLEALPDRKKVAKYGLMSCCCCCLLLAIHVAILLMFLSAIDTYAICHLNLCGHEEGGASLEKYQALDFSGLDAMNETCAAKLERAAAAGRDQSVYLKLWFHNPNLIEMKLKSMSIVVSRARSLNSQRVEESEFLYCTVDDFRMQPGDVFVHARCVLPVHMKPYVAQILTDFVKCGEVVVKEDIQVTLSKGYLEYSHSSSLKTTLENPLCNTSAEPSKGKSLFGREPMCPGTTDVRLQRPILWLCSVSVNSLFNLEFRLGLLVYNPTVFRLSLTTLVINIYSGKLMDTLIATIEMDDAMPPIEVAPKEYKDFVLIGRVEKLYSITKLVKQPRFLVSGYWGASLLGFQVSHAVIPPISVDIVSDDSTPAGPSPLRELLGGACTCLYGGKPGIKACTMKTGASCSFAWKCGSWRKATCVNNTCVCGRDECVDRGKCVDRSTYLSLPR